MPVDAFGRQALTVDEIRDALNKLSEAGHGNEPVWVRGRSLYHPCRAVGLSDKNRPSIEIYHG